VDYQHLEEQVKKNLKFIREDLKDSPMSATIHIYRGIGYLEAIEEHYGVDCQKLISELEKALPQIPYMK